MPHHPFESAAQKILREYREREEQLKRLTEGGVLEKALRDARQHEEQLKRVTEGGAIEKALRDARQHEEQLKRVTEGGVLEKALRDARQQEEQLKRLTEGGVLEQALRGVREREEQLKRFTELSPPFQSGHSWLTSHLQHTVDAVEPMAARRSEDLRRIAEDANRAKEVVESEIEQTDAVEEEDKFLALEAVRDALSDQARTSRRAARLERFKERKADADYWFRQWTNSLAIGNGAGFLAVTTGLLSSSNFERSVSVVAAPITSFGVGLVLAGGLRLGAWARQAAPKGRLRRYIGQAMGWGATLSAALFVLGVVFAVGQVWQSHRSSAELAQRKANVEATELRVRELEAADRLEKALQAQAASVAAKRATAVVKGAGKPPIPTQPASATGSASPPTATPPAQQPSAVVP